MTRRGFALAIAATLLLAPSTMALAEEFPTKPIRVIVPFSAGGAMDVVMRVVGKKVTEMGGPEIVVENRTGGGGAIGVRAVRDAPPDGYTLLEASSSTHVVNPHITPDIPYDPLKDFQPITMLVTVPTILAVPGTSPVKSVSDLQQLARSKPGGLSYGSAGVGSVPHLAAELLARAFGTPMTHVPYRGMASVIPDLITGRIDFVFGSIASFGGAIDDGKIRLLAVASDKPIPTRPQLPTLPQLGHHDVVLDLWFGLFAPTGIDAKRVQILNGMFVKAAKTPDVVARFEELGVSLATSTPQEFRKAIEADHARIGALIREVMPKGK
jgi:tripartite-type tricarboxylate transporter receptor subunit TctC